MADGAGNDLTASALPANAVAALSRVGGGTGVQPIGVSVVAFTQPNGTKTSIAVIAGLVDSGVVLDDTLSSSLRTGDKLTVAGTSSALTVTSFADTGGLEHLPTAYVSLKAWHGLRDSSLSGMVSGFLVSGSASRSALAAAALGSVAVSPSAAISAVPGYAVETGTLKLITDFLMAISALVIGTLFWIFMLQKEGPLAVLRSAGANARLLVGSFLVQVGATTLLGIGLALIAVLLAGLALPAAIFALPASAVAEAAALLTILALAASTASVRRLLTADPLTALGRIS